MLHHRVVSFRRGVLLAVLSAAAFAAAPAASAQDWRGDYDPEVRYAVTSPGDGADARIDGTCATPAGGCTLRAALQEAANDHAKSHISFALKPGERHTINVATALPALRDLAGPTIIDGTIQYDPKLPSYMVEIKGPGSGSGVDGLTITSTGNEVRGLSIYNFRNQIRITGWNNHITRNHLGTDRAATWVAPATWWREDRAGVLIEGDAANNRVGDAWDEVGANIISGNAGHGVLVRGTASANTVDGNHIGLAPAIRGALPNSGHGAVLGPRTRFNVVGGNYIAANRGNGVVVGGLQNRVIGNYLGLRPRGHEEPYWTVLSNGATNVVVGPSTEARIRENRMAGTHGGVTVAGPEITGTHVVRNSIGGKDLTDRSRSIGVEVRDGARVAVAWNQLTYHYIGMLLQVPIHEERNVFEFNGNDVVGP